MVRIGIDLGGTNIAAGIVDDEGIIIHKGSVPTNSSRHYTEIVADMGALANRILQEKNIPRSVVECIGVGSPGVPDSKNGIIIYNCNLGFYNVNLRTELQKHIDLPVFVENDANCAAIAESVVGAAKGINHAVMVTIGTGIGGGIIINGKIYTGFNGAAGELGHMVVRMNGEPCNCGRKGCFEAYSSATALIRQTKQAIEKTPSPVILSLCGGDTEKINAKTAFDAMRQGDAVGTQIVSQYIDYFAESLANLVNIFQPELIVLGGGVSKEGETLLAPLRERMEPLTYCPDGLKKPALVVAKMRNDAGIVGAAMISKASN